MVVSETPQFSVNTEFKQGIVQDDKNNSFMQMSTGWDRSEFPCDEKQNPSKIYRYTKMLATQPLTQLEFYMQLLTSAKPKYFFAYSYTDVKEFSKSEDILITHTFSNLDGLMRQYDYSVITIVDVVSKVGGLLAPIRLTYFVLVSIMLTRKFWKAEAESIVMQQRSIRGDNDDSMQEIQDKMKQRLSFCAIYNLFDHVQEQQKKIDELTFKMDEYERDKKQQERKINLQDKEIQQLKQLFEQQNSMMDKMLLSHDDFLKRQ